MLFLSYLIGRGALTALPFLFIIPTAMVLFSVFAVRSLKAKADEHFTYEDKLMEELLKEKELENEM